MGERGGDELVWVEAPFVKQEELNQKSSPKHTCPKRLKCENLGGWRGRFLGLGALRKESRTRRGVSGPLNCSQEPPGSAAPVGNNRRSDFS